MSKAAELAALIANVNKGSSLAAKNFIINGAMTVAQRGTSAVAVGSGTYPSVDRIKCWESTDGAYTGEQSTSVPSGQGFSNSTKLAVTTADTSLAASQYSQIAQVIEAQNLQSLAYGTSDAKTITLSFWVRSNKTGTYCVTIVKEDSTTAHYVKEYSISSADTWEKKTITIVPDSNITSGAGAIANDNGAGLIVYWNLAMGTTFDDATDNAWSTNTNHWSTTNQVNWMDSTSNTFYLTGVQLEIGEKATEFEHEPYEATLAKCQRYYLRRNSESGQVYTYFGAGHVSNAGAARVYTTFPVQMNHVPVLETTGTASNYVCFNIDTDALTSMTITNASLNESGLTLNDSGNNLTAGRGCNLIGNNTTDAFIAFESEL